MVTIIDARTARGWDSCDHLIDDSDAASLIGRSYPSRAAMLRAVKKAEEHPHAWPMRIEYRIAGTTREYLMVGTKGVPHREDRRID